MFFIGHYLLVCPIPLFAYSRLPIFALILLLLLAKERRRRREKEKD